MLSPPLPPPPQMRIHSLRVLFSAQMYTVYSYPSIVVHRGLCRKSFRTVKIVNEIRIREYNEHKHTMCVYVTLCYANTGGWQWRRWEKEDNATKCQRKRRRRRRRMAHSVPPSSASISLSHQLTLNNIRTNIIILIYFRIEYICMPMPMPTSLFGKGKGESRKSHIIYFPTESQCSMCVCVNVIHFIQFRW